MSHFGSRIRLSRKQNRNNPMNEIRARGIKQIIQDEGRINRKLTTPHVSLKSCMLFNIITAIVCTGVGAYLVNRIHCELVLR